MVISPRINLNYDSIHKLNAAKDIQNVKPRQSINDAGVCKTCASRTYQDKSNDIGVSFQAPTQISPSEAPSAVASHEQEHVSNNRISAQKSGGDILFQNVSIQTNICPECKRVYVSGGVTKSVAAYNSSNQSNENKVGNIIDTFA